jgi:nucleotide-binding universal stress UspA family protein
VAAIVVGIDASSGSAAALAWAATEARLRNVALVAVHAYWVPFAYVHDDFSVARVDPELHRQAEDDLDRVLQQADAVLADVHVVRRLHPGGPTEALIDEAAAADLLVVGRRGAGGFKGLLLGSTAEHCARHAPGPVVVVQESPHEPRGRILVGIDGSSQARSALIWAVDHAQRHGATVEALSVYELYDAPGPYGGEFMRIASPFSEQRFRRRAEQFLADAAAAAGPVHDAGIEPHTEPGHPAEILVARSREADLVAVGSRGLGGLSGVLLGSVSRQLLHHAHCSVAVVR